MGDGDGCSRIGQVGVNKGMLQGTRRAWFIHRQHKHMIKGQVSHAHTRNPPSGVAPGVARGGVGSESGGGGGVPGRWYRVCTHPYPVPCTRPSYVLRLKTHIALLQKSQGLITGLRGYLCGGIIYLLISVKAIVKTILKCPLYIIHWSIQRCARHI